MSTRIVTLLSVFLGLVCFSSCMLFARKHDEIWSASTVQTQSESVLYEVIHVSLQKAGYPVGVGADRGARHVTSGWFRSGAPFRGKGYRQRVSVTYAPDVESNIPGQFLISVRTEREINQSFRPLDPRHVDWEQDSDNAVESERVLQYIRSFLAGGELEVNPKKSSQFDLDGHSVRD